MRNSQAAFRGCDRSRAVGSKTARTASIAALRSSADIGTSSASDTTTSRRIRATAVTGGLASSFVSEDAALVSTGAITLNSDCDSFSGPRRLPALTTPPAQRSLLLPIYYSATTSLDFGFRSAERT